MKEKNSLDQQLGLSDVLPFVIQRISASSAKGNCFQQLDSSPMPSRDDVAGILNMIRGILFPGYFTQNILASSNLETYLKVELNALYSALMKQIIFADQHDCLRDHQPCAECEQSGRVRALEFIQTLPELREILATDVRAAMEGDPAAKSYGEVITSYPGLYAIQVQRIAHELYKMRVPGLPRAMTEYAHSITGIDIHPGAEIGKSFFIDHGTGVVVGETTEIGNRVRLYQGVTLGALSMPKEAVESFRNKKRHPTIEDDVIIYSNTTILGGETVIGARSTIGGNAWITESVPPDTKVYLKKPELVYAGNGENRNATAPKKIFAKLFASRANEAGC